MKLPPTVMNWLESILWAVLMVAVLFLLCWPFKIEGQSMENTLQSGDRIVVSRLLKYMGQIHAGDLVVCRLETFGRTEIVVKRIVATPGEHVEIKDGQFYLNGQVCKEEYLGNTVTNGAVNVTLGPDEFFVMGDNRPVSFDSRAAGPVSKDMLVGKVLWRWYPMGRLAVF